MNKSVDFYSTDEGLTHLENRINLGKSNFDTVLHKEKQALMSRIENGTSILASDIKQDILSRINPLELPTFQEELKSLGTKVDAGRQLNDNENRLLEQIALERKINNGEVDFTNLSEKQRLSIFTNITISNRSTLNPDIQKEIILSEASTVGNIEKWANGQLEKGNKVAGYAGKGLKTAYSLVLGGIDDIATLRWNGRKDLISKMDYVWAGFDVASIVPGVGLGAKGVGLAAKGATKVGVKGLEGVSKSLAKDCVKTAVASTKPLTRTVAVGVGAVGIADQMATNDEKGKAEITQAADSINVDGGNSKDNGFVEGLMKMFGGENGFDLSTLFGEGGKSFGNMLSKISGNDLMTFAKSFFEMATKIFNLVMTSFCQDINKNFGMSFNPQMGQ